MLRLSRVLIFLFSTFLYLPAFSQTKEDLKKQKTELEKEINYTTELLNKTKSNKNKSLNYLKVLESQIKSKEQLLITLNIEISLLSKQIKKTEILILKNKESIVNEEKALQSLKDEYAKMIYVAHKQKGSRNELMFIISSSDFNQAYKRMIYLRQYSAFRKNQALKITESQIKLIKNKEKLGQQKDRLIEESATKRLLVSNKKDELESVNSTKDEKQKLVNKLSRSEKLFKKRLQVNQKKAKELDDKLRKIIEEEIRKAREEAKKRNGNDNFSLTPEALALSSEFVSNKGRLPWPLEMGVIISKYGKQKHAVFSGVETFNNGIDIATDKNTAVRVIFDGTVSRIFFIKGQGKAVLINHGEYFSVYSGLKEVSVKTGDKLLSKEKIGVVITNEQENKTELHFEIWKGYDKHDPSNWLYKAY
jgi:septal ring factor EnvC (AmiA/AmiB activator)